MLSTQRVRRYEGGTQLEKQAWILEPDTLLGVGPGRAASQLCDAGLIT